MVILGLNAYHGDAAAALVIDGQLIGAAEEERFRRIKHWAGFPAEAVKFCLDQGGIKIGQVDHVAVNRNPRAHLARKALFTLRARPSRELIRDRLRNAAVLGGIQASLAEPFLIDGAGFKPRIHLVEHHLAHLSGAFLVSPFDQAAVVSLDGFGDFVGAMWGTGEGKRLKVRGRVFFPHSLGLFYQAVTQFLGFPQYGDEYKVMGLAAYGEPVLLPEMRRMVRLNGRGGFRLDLHCFRHHSPGVALVWEDGAPLMGPVYSPAMETILGPARRLGEPLQKRHEDIASATQAMYEEAFFQFLNEVHHRTGMTRLCLGGGCALNSVANGKIFDRTPFQEVYIPPAPGDAGGAIGAAYWVWNRNQGPERGFALTHPYWGPDFSTSRIREALAAREGELARAGCSPAYFPDPALLARTTAREIARGKIVGWFQGRMEWGPRALGNRSILADPRRGEMKKVLNDRIKRREPFRPFAPAVLLERVGEYFEKSYPDPFMVKVYPVRPEKRSAIPAVVHVDGTGRLQTVSREDNPLYWRLIKEYESLTGVPVVLNTSFNENEPMVCTPAEALDCFFRTRMDAIVLGPYFVARQGEGR